MVPCARKVAPLWPPAPALRLAASALNTSTNRPPMILRLASGSLTPASLPRNRSGVHADDLGVQLALEHFHDHVAFVQAQQAVVHEDAGQLVADGAVDQG